MVLLIFLTTFFNFFESISETFNSKRCSKLVFYKAKRLNSVVESWNSRRKNYILLWNCILYRLIQAFSQAKLFSTQPRCCLTFSWIELQMLLSIQFDWKLLIIYFGFRLINILLRKFDTSSEKEMKMIKTPFFWCKYNNNKKCHESICKYKAAFFTMNSPRWPLM